MPETALHTYGEFLARVKLEAKLNDSSEDSLILSLVNECLTILCGMDDYKIDFRLNEVLYPVLNPSTTDLTNIFIDEIKQIIYLYRVGGVNKGAWELTESNDVPSTPANEDAVALQPSQYKIAPITIAANQIDWKLTFLPYASASTNSLIDIIATGFKTIVDSNSIIPAKSCYAALVTMVLQRLQIKRNAAPSTIQALQQVNEQAVVSSLKSGGEIATTTNENDA